MFDKSKIVTSVYGIVGLRQPLNTDYDVLDTANTTSRSGYYANDNPFAKVEFLYDNQDKVGINDTQFNSLVKQIQCSSINDVCNEVFNEADYIDRNFLFINPINKVTTETLTSNTFVGYKIKLCKEKCIAFEVTRCRCEFSGTGTVKLLLFSSQDNAPIKSQVVTINNGNIVQDLKWVVDGSGTNYKADYYIGYLTSSLTGGVLPYVRDYEDSTIQSSLSLLDITPITVPNKTTETFWDMSTEDVNGSNYFGINPDITVFYDYTDLILRNEQLLAKAIDISFQIKIMQTYIATSRSNRNQRISDDLITKAMAEIEGISEAPNTITKKGLRYLLLGEIRSIRSEIVKLREGYFINGHPQIITLQ